MTSPEEALDASGLRFAIVASRYHHEIVAALVEDARACLDEHGAAEVLVDWVPGAFELPLGCLAHAETQGLDAVLALGCVIRGETPHFEFVAREVASGVMSAMLDTGVPIAFGVLTTEDAGQARARAGGAQGNKGREAALTAIEMALLMRRIENGGAENGAVPNDIGENDAGDA